jgi:putative ABC transport system permease protein
MIRLPFFTRRRRERELDAEIAAHLAMAAADRVARGERPEVAEAAARRELGNEGLVKEATRAQWGWGPFERLGQDLRYGLRLLRRAPGFAAVAIATLALGIGANTAILSVVHAILVRPLPYEDAGRLVALLTHGTGPVAPGNFLDWKARSRSFASMGAADLWSANFTGGESPEKVSALRITPEILPMMGVRPQLGRFFRPEESVAGRDRVVVIGDALWRRRFGADPAILGRAIPLNGERYTVLGVMPPGFVFAPFWATRSEIWAPLDLQERANNREGQSLRVFARLRNGVSLAAAREEIAAITAALEREFPGTNRDVRVVPLLERVVGNVRPALLVLLAAVGLVLLIACVNVANMLLARSSVRRREIALRAAIGASRSRTVRQLLTESVVLAVAGGGLGTALGAWGLRALVALAPPETPRLADIRLDPRVLIATLALSLATGIAFGLAPALQASRIGLREALAEGGAAGAGRDGGRLRHVFVAAEVALALVLLIGAGLMLRSFAALRRVDPGFDPRGVVTLEVSVNGTAQAAPARRAALYREIQDRFSALPGVVAAGAINHVPLAGDIWRWPYAIEGRPRSRPGESASAVYRAVLPGYFKTMRLPILRGRDIEPNDISDSPAAVVINEHMARRSWPGQDPIGRRISLDDRTWVTVVGVAKDAAQADWGTEPDDEIYLALLQTRQLLESPEPSSAYITYVVRAGGDAAAIVPALRSAVRSIDPTLPVSAVYTMDDVVAGANGRTRFQMLLLGIFAAAAALLAAVGIYGVMSYTVSSQSRDIGVRLALGADPRRVRREIVGRGMRVAGAGAAAGLVAALLLTRLMSAVLYGVRSTDPATYAGVASLLLAIAFVASDLPARRAARLDPVRALRAE